MIKGDWTISFLWRPESSWREVHGVLPIATVRLLDNSYATLSYEATYDVSDNRTGGQFVLTDGANTITITADAGWLFADVLKFAIVHEDGVGVTLHVETPTEGTLDESDGSMAYDDYLHFIQFSANADGEVKGLGAYGDTKFYDSALSAVDVQKIFDLDPTAPTAALTQRAGQMVFARDSIRFDKDAKEVAANVADKQSCLLASGNVDYDDVSPDSMILRFCGETYAYASNQNVLYRTTDGETLEVEVDLSTLDGYGPGTDMIIGGAALDDGSILISTYQYDTNIGKIWRKDPTTGTWSKVLDLIGGYVANFGWTGVRGAEIVIGEYCNPNTDADEGTRVYYSPDYGQTWTMIWQREGKNEGDNMHVHCVAFSPSDTDTFYASFGDSEHRGIHKIVCTNPANKSNPESWTFDSIVSKTQPTSVIAHNGKLYWGHDGSGRSHLILEHDPETETFKGIYNGIPTASSNDDSPYSTHSPGIDVWAIKKIGGLFYAALASSVVAAKPLGGLYVSSDMNQWQRVWCATGQDGVWHVDGDGSGRVWMRSNRPDGVSRPILFTPNRQSVSLITASRGITNLYSKENSIFDTNIGNWDFTNDYNSTKTGWDTSHKLVGGGALRLAPKVGAAGYMIANGPYVTLNAGDRFVMSAWLYIPISWAAISADGNAPQISIWAYTSSDIEWDTSSWAPVLAPGQWVRSALWGRAINQVDARVRLIFSGLSSAPEDADYYEVWVDCVQVVKYEDMHFSRDWQIGGTPRADEILIAPAYDVGRGGLAPAGYVSGRGFVS